MRAGKMDRRIEIFKEVVTRNDSLEHIRTPTLHAEVYADFMQNAFSERYVIQQRKAEVTAVFLIRWRGDLNPTMWVEYDGLKYDIIGTLEIGRRETLSINAKARTDNAGSI